MPDVTHQYVDRATQEALDERLFGDRIVRFLYTRGREWAPELFRMLTGPTTTMLLGYLQFDLPLASHLLGNRRFLRATGVNLDECVARPAAFVTPRQIFERQIRYWECRPMPEDPGAVVAPADARVLVGRLEADPALFIKDKFFSLHELLGPGRASWAAAFAGGDYAIFRLTPEKYHYNHTPVAGRVVDFYEVQGVYHSCNPAAIVEIATPYSKNKRVVTVFDTDLPGGSQVGLVVMVEVVALMIGEVVPCYSLARYDNPGPLAIGQDVHKGQPKSLFRPGSSTTILLFERGRVAFSSDLATNAVRADIRSRFSRGFGHPIVETEIAVRSEIACRIP